MNRLTVLIAGLGIAAALSAAPAFARPAHAPARASCCRAPAGTVVEVELVDPVSTKTQKTGDTFALRLAAPMVVNGQIVLRAGARGVGQVVEAARPGLGGKPAELVLAARYIERGRARVPLQGLRLAAAGHDNSKAAQVVGLSGIVFGPLGLVGMAVQGGNVDFPAGTRATARLASDVTLPALGRASHAMIAAAAVSTAGAVDAATGGWIEIPPPPAGSGQVVFFRRKSLLGTGQWFNVRENGKALGKLSNGAYFVEVATPGPHTYTATSEPELKDHLTLEVAPGESYFVEGTLTKGLVIGAADLSPSDRARFDEASKDLKLAAAPEAAPSGAPVAGTDATPAPADDVAAKDTEQAGYLWAQQGGIRDPAACPATPPAYRAGCLAYVGEAPQH
jgi:hypothetical protein